MTLDSTAMLTTNGTNMDYGVSLQQLASSMNGGSLPNAGNGNGGSAPPHEPMGQMVNPIDRLYSMQNSYFCNQDNPTISCPSTPTGHPGTPPGGLNHHRPTPGSGAQQPNPMHLQHPGLQQQPMPSHHFPTPSNNGPNIVGLGVSNVGMGQHMIGMCNPMLEQQQHQQQQPHQQQQQQQQESVM
uniref:Uncharacterized protein n=1 Tax=Anopheles culicifacies TaxID=139723 RepID=A0A182MDZ5_9DIPT